MSLEDAAAVEASDAEPPHAEARWPRPQPYDLATTMRFVGIGGRDPASRLGPGVVWHAAWTPDQRPFTVRLAEQGDWLSAQGWGEGAAWAVARADRLMGLHDAPGDLVARDPAVASLERRFPALRLADTGCLVGALVPTVVRQLVTFVDARASWKALVARHGEPAPGPAGLRLPPRPSVLGRLPSFDLRACGIGARQARTLNEVGRRAASIERLSDLPHAELSRRLQSIAGLGPWTVEWSLGFGLGRPDAVPTGDYHLPNTVAYALAGEARADDARMLALLAPYAGQRFRVLRLLFAADAHAPRYGPKSPTRRGRADAAS